MPENEVTLVFKSKCVNVTNPENASHILPEIKLERFERCLI